MRLPKLETLIIGIFLLCTALWMVSKCGDRRSRLLDRTAPDEEREDRPVRRDTVVLSPQPSAQPVVSTPTTQPATQPTTTTPVTTTPTPAPGRTPVASTPSATPTTTPAAKTATPTTKPTTASTTAKSSGTMLFVTIDGLKMRKEPGLKSETVAKLDLHEQVTFLNQRTEWSQEISLGYEKVTDHWVKVRNKAGKEGWVFGAGVNYYKGKRKGVMD